MKLSEARPYKILAGYAPGGIAPGSVTYNHIKIVQAALGLPIQLVSSYQGTSDKFFSTSVARQVRAATIGHNPGILLIGAQEA
jgi:hypothetical protein